MSNSPLAKYKKISPNKSAPRNHVIDTITIHCMAGQLSIESCGNVFASPSRKASSNYGIGPDGRIGLYVEEKDRSWATSSSTNDNRAITIEVASDSKHPYAVKNAAYDSLIKLVADICKRNGIKKLKWSKSKDDRMNHKNGCNMTVHRDYSAKACPGDFLYNRMDDIANKVNKILGNSSNNNESDKKPVFKVGERYTLKEELKVRKGPGTKYEAKKYKDLTDAAKKYDKDKDGALDKGTVINCKQVEKENGNIWIKVSSGWICGYYKGKQYIK